MSALTTGQKAQWLARCALVEVDIDAETATIRARGGDGPTIEVAFADLEGSTTDTGQSVNHGLRVRNAETLRSDFQRLILDHEPEISEITARALALLLHQRVLA
jgi:hypothetical protein